MVKGKIVALATVTIPPANTPQKLRTESLVANPRWKYVGPACTINLQWQIGKKGITFDGKTVIKYGTAQQPASNELAPFDALLAAIPLSPLSPGFYDCEIWFRSSAFSDLRVIVENCVRVVEEIAYTISLSVSPPGWGSVTKSPDKPSYPHGSEVLLTAIPAYGYSFDRWSGSISSISNPQPIILHANAVITANFKTIAPTKYVLTTAVSPAGSGSVTRSPNQAEYDVGTLVVLTAVPAAGYYFDHWEGDASGSSVSIGVRMDGNRSVTAVFKVQVPEEEYFTVTFTNNPVSGGYITPEPWLVQYKKYDVVACTAVGNVGWTLDHWTVNGVTYTGWKIYVTVVGNTTITAHWRLK